MYQESLHVTSHVFPERLRQRISNLTEETIGGLHEIRFEITPSSELTGIVDHFWYRTSLGCSLPERFRWILPSGNVHIIFPIHGYEIRNAYVVSSVSRAAMVHLSGVQECIGIRFKPVGARLLLPFRISELEQYYAWTLSDIFPAVRTLEDKLREITGIAEKIIAVEQFLTSKAPNRSSPPVLKQAVSMIIRSFGNISISSVAEKCGISQRQLQRISIEYLGVSPYKYCRIIRFLNACKCLTKADDDMAVLAYTLGYSDQSHFIREFKSMSRYTPREYVLNIEKKIIGHATRLYRTFPVQDPAILM